MVRDFECFHEGASLVDSFLIFALGNGIGDDSAAGLNVGAAVFGDQSAEGDAGIEVAGEIEIQDCASVKAAAGGLEFVNNFHGTNFRRAGKSACGKAGHERVEAIHIGT